MLRLHTKLTAGLICTDREDDGTAMRGVEGQGHPEPAVKSSSLVYLPLLSWFVF